MSEFICYYTILHWLCKLQEGCISSMLILLKGLWPVYMFQNLKWLVIYFMWLGLLFILIIDLRSFCSTFYHVSNMAYELWAHQVARILLFIYFFVHMAIHFDQVSDNWTWKLLKLMLSVLVFLVILHYWLLTRYIMVTYSSAEMKIIMPSHQCAFGY